MAKLVLPNEPNLRDPGKAAGGHQSAADQGVLPQPLVLLVLHDLDVGDDPDLQGLVRQPKNRAMQKPLVPLSIRVLQRRRLSGKKHRGPMILKSAPISSVLTGPTIKV